MGATTRQPRNDNGIGTAREALRLYDHLQHTTQPRFAWFGRCRRVFEGIEQYDVSVVDKDSRDQLFDLAGKIE